MENELIIKSLKDICDATTDISKCLNDDEYLCNKLNKIDLNFINQFYRSEKEGVVIDIRKEVAKNILLSGLTVDLMLNIISNHKVNNPQKLKAWSNPYRILHPLINNSYVYLDNFIIDFIEILTPKIGDVKYTISDFNGSQHQGSNEYWVAFYNKEHKSQSDGNQIFINFFNSEMTYGIYNHIDKKYLIGPIKVDFDKFRIDDVFNFINDNKHIIIDEKIESGMTFHNAAKLILEEFGNKPMSANEIWSEIEKRRLVKTGGKTPAASLNTIILTDSVDSPVTSSRNSKNIFKIVSNSPHKFILNNFMPKHIKENLTKNGFITVDMLKDIFEKNGLKFEF